MAGPVGAGTCGEEAQDLQELMVQGKTSRSPRSRCSAGRQSPWASRAWLGGPVTEASGHCDLGLADVPELDKRQSGSVQGRGCSESQEKGKAT